LRSEIARLLLNLRQVIASNRGKELVQVTTAAIMRTPDCFAVAAALSLTHLRAGTFSFSTRRQKRLLFLPHRRRI